MPSFVFSEEPAKPVKIEGGAATIDVKVTNTAAGEKVGTVLVEPEPPAVLDWFAEDFDLAELRTLAAVERMPGLRPLNTAYDGR